VEGTRRGQGAGQRQEPLSKDIEAHLLRIHEAIEGHPQVVPDLSAVL
jgi:hypothetical protein